MENNQLSTEDNYVTGNTWPPPPTSVIDIEAKKVEAKIFIYRETKLVFIGSGNNWLRNLLPEDYHKNNGWEKYENR